MSGQNTLEYCALNVVTHPHSPEKYITLFKTALRQRNLGIINKNNSAIITSVYETNESVGKWKTTPLEGEICKFMNIDQDSDWFNLETNKIAKEHEKNSISIPENLKPNSQRFSFIFFPDIHILFVEIKDRKNKTSPSVVRKAFESIFNYQNTKKLFKRIDITVLPQSDKVEEALNLKVLEKIEYRVTRPNPDHVPVDEEEYLNDLDAQDIDEIVKTIYGQQGGSIKLKKNEEDIVRIASRNGYVKARGQDAYGNKKKVDTHEHPWVKKQKYNPNLQTAWNAIIQNIGKSIKELIPKQK